jgi:hypothetical protein
VPETVTIQDGSTVVFHTTETADAVRAEFVRRLYATGEKVRARMVENISEPSPPPSDPGDFPHADTGLLRNSLFSVVDEDEMSFTVGSPLAYALYLEFGTAGGQIIRPTSGSVLSWVDPRTGQRHYAKWVRLGPIRPRPFMRRTFAEMEAEIARDLTAPIPDAAFPDLAQLSAEPGTLGAGAGG